MDEFMIRLLNMSFTAGCTCLIVLVLRVFLKRLPKIYSYALWGIVLFRFLCPFTFESALSLLPVSPETVSSGIVYERTPSIDSGVVWFDQTVNQVLDKTMAVGEEDLVRSVNPIQVALFIWEVIWMAGVAGFGIYHLISYLCLKRKLADAVRLRRSVYASERITSPFAMGIWKPRIYLPYGLSKAEERCIVAHEWIHIRRRDGLVKMFGIAAVMLHWFNPLAWVSVILMCKDMEMACDEKALKQLGMETRQQYTLTLYKVSAKHSGLVLPTAFGESNTKIRIKNLLSYKKPALWATVCAAAVLVLAAFTLMTNPKKQPEALAAVSQREPEENREADTKSGVRMETQQDEHAVSVIGGADGPTSIFVAGKNVGSHGIGNEELAEIQLDVSGEKSPAVIDQAEGQYWLIHGDFGFYAFSRGEGAWEPWKTAAYLEGESLEEVRAMLEAAREKDGPADTGYLDRLGLTGGIRNGMRMIAYDNWEREDGTIAVLGSFSDTDRLIDLFYGIYDKETRILSQVYPFAGDRITIKNKPGKVSYRRYLFTVDGYDYFVRSPQTLLGFETNEPVSGRAELVRYLNDEAEVLDRMVCLVKDGASITCRNGEIVYPAAAENTAAAFQNPVVKVRKIIP